MKNKTSLSLKRTLLATLPCFALSLFAVSCSDDDSAVVTDNTTKGKTITFTTGDPVITDYSTRLGLNEDNLPTDAADDETLIWHDGDELAFNFVKYGETVGKVYPYTISPVGSGRYDITTDSEINISNGLYEVHVVSPGLEPDVKTFKGGDVTATTIDLRGQEQPETTDNYKNLTDYYYQYAYTLLKIEDNEIVHGGSYLEFTALTSLIRYRITNSFDDPIQVVKINLSYNDDSTSPFYTRGTFDPTAAKPAIQPVGSPVKTLALKTEKTLAKGEQFNAFLSMLPISIPASTNITYTVFFNMGGQLYKKVWNVTAANLANGNMTAGGRWLQGLTMTDGNVTLADESELLDEQEDESEIIDGVPYETDGGYSVSFDGNEYDVYSINALFVTHASFDRLDNVTNNSEYSNYSSLTTMSFDQVCPVGWEILTAKALNEMTLEDRVSFISKTNLNVGLLNSSGVWYGNADYVYIPTGLLQMYGARIGVFTSIYSIKTGESRSDNIWHSGYWFDYRCIQYAN